MGPAHLEELARLGDVLGGGAPVHVAAGVSLARMVQRPHQRHQRVAGARQTLPDRPQIQERQVSLADDLPRGGRGNHPQLTLRLGKRGLDIQPGLEASRLGEQCPYTGVVDPERGGLFQHGRGLC